MHDLCSALAYLHTMKIAHRFVAELCNLIQIQYSDVKPENLLLYTANNVRHTKLADFGLACECEHENALRTVEEVLHLVNEGQRTYRFVARQHMLRPRFSWTATATVLRYAFYKKRFKK